MSHKVFLSYAFQDRALAESVKAGIAEFLPQNDKEALDVVDVRTDVAVGEDVRQSVKAAIEKARTVVIISSASADESPWVNYEAGLADAMKKSLVVVGKKGSEDTALWRRFFETAKIIKTEHGYIAAFHSAVDNRKAVPKQVAEMTEFGRTIFAGFKPVHAKATAVTDKASGNWDRLEQVFEDRVARALSSLGVPSKKEIDKLTKRIAELTAAVQKMSDAREGKDANPPAPPATVPTTAQAAAPKAASARKPAATKSGAAKKLTESASA